MTDNTNTQIENNDITNPDHDISVINDVNIKENNVTSNDYDNISNNNMTENGMSIKKFKKRKKVNIDTSANDKTNNNIQEENEINKDINDVTNRKLLDKSIDENIELKSISNSNNKKPSTFLDKLNEQKKEKEKNNDKLKKIVKTANKDSKNLMVNMDTSCLVFVVMGTLKINGFPKHMWIMIIDTNFEDITFFEPTSRKMYKLKKRVEYPILLEKYLKEKYITENEILKDLKFMEMKDKPIKSDEKPLEQHKNKKNKLTKIIDENEELHKEFNIEQPFDLLINMEMNQHYTNLKNKTAFGTSNSNAQLTTQSNNKLKTSQNNGLDEQLHKVLNLKKKNKKM